MEKESKTEEEDSSNENKPDSVGEEDPGEEEEEMEEEEALAAASEVLSVRFFDAAPQTVSNFLLPLLLWSIIIYRRIKTMIVSRQEGLKYPLLRYTRVYGITNLYYLKKEKARNWPLRLVLLRQLFCKFCSTKLKFDTEQNHFQKPATRILFYKNV